MNNKFLAALSILAVSLSACRGNASQSEAAGNDGSQFEDSVVVKSPLADEDIEKLAEYVKLEDDERFVLDITEDEALKAGISKETYEAACEDIRRENANIQEYKRSDEFKKNGGQIKAFGLRKKSE